MENYLLLANKIIKTDMFDQPKWCLLLTYTHIPSFHLTHNRLVADMTYYVAAWNNAVCDLSLAYALYWTTLSEVQHIATGEKSDSFYHPISQSSIVTVVKWIFHPQAQL